MADRLVVCHRYPASAVALAEFASSGEEAVTAGRPAMLMITRARTPSCSRLQKPGLLASPLEKRLRDYR